MPHAAIALHDATAYVADLIEYRHTTDCNDLALIAETTETASELASSARDFIAAHDLMSAAYCTTLALLLVPTIDL